MQPFDRRQFSLAALAAPLALASANARSSAVNLEEIARTFAELSRREYHDAQLGERLAARVEAHLSSGAYAAADSPDSLAAALMKDAEEVTNDRHFYVMTGMHHGMAPSIRPGARRKRPDPEELKAIEADGFGLHSVEIDGGVGVIDIRRFYAPYAETKAAFAEAMRTVSAARALIFDLRKNVGGDPASVAYLSSFLFERETFVINRFHWRSSGIEEFLTSAVRPIFPEDRPVFAATSASTFSAGEEFAYNLQALKRATIIGEATGGGANHAEMFVLGGDVVAFIPCARAENPVTGTNWEGVGVQPDVRIAAKDAFAEAMRRTRA